MLVNIAVNLKIDEVVKLVFSSNPSSTKKEFVRILKFLRINKKKIKALTQHEDDTHIKLVLNSMDLSPSDLNLIERFKV